MKNIKGRIALIFAKVPISFGIAGVHETCYSICYKLKKGMTITVIPQIIFTLKITRGSRSC